MDAKIRPVEVRPLEWAIRYALGVELSKAGKRLPRRMGNHLLVGRTKTRAVVNLGIASIETHTPHGLLTPMGIDAAGMSIPRNGLLA
jgi:hypothetical protein